jgi:hypothetical protein
MLYEIRNYHYDPKYYEEYKKWAAEVGAPFFRKRWDVVGAWVNTDIPAEYGGSLPRDESLIPADMTWIIRWKDKEHRDKAWAELDQKELEKLFSTVPGGRKSYLRTEAKFAEAI